MRSNISSNSLTTGNSSSTNHLQPDWSKKVKYRQYCTLGLTILHSLIKNPNNINFPLNEKKENRKFDLKI